MINALLLGARILLQNIRADVWRAYITIIRIFRVIVCVCVWKQSQANHNVSCEHDE